MNVKQARAKAESVHDELARLGFVIVKQPGGPNETDTHILW